MEQISKLFDRASNYFAHRKGLLPIIGILLIFLNFFIGIFAPGAFADTNLFLHLGTILSIIGIMLAWAL